MRRDANKFVDNLKEIREFIDNNGHVPRIKGGVREHYLYNWIAITVDQFRCDKLSDEEVESIRTICPEMYYRCTHNNRDTLAKVDEFREWLYANMKYPRVDGDEVESKMYSFITNLRAKMKNNTITEDEVSALNSISPILLNSRRPSVDFDAWIIQEVLNSRLVDGCVTLDKLNLTAEEIKYFVSKDTINLFEIYSKLIDCVSKVYNHESAVEILPEHEVDEARQYLKMCGFYKPLEDSICIELFSLIDPEVSVGDIRLLCEIFGTNAFYILADKNFRVKQVSRRLHKVIVQMHSDKPIYTDVVIKRFYGFKTLGDIGDEYTVQREAIRQKEEKLLRYMRTYANYLKGFEFYTVSESDDGCSYHADGFDSLSVRARNVLKRQGIYTDVELYEYVNVYGVESINKFRNAGTKTVAEITALYKKLCNDGVDARDNKKNELVNTKIKTVVDIKFDDPDLKEARQIIYNALNLRGSGNDLS